MSNTADNIIAKALECGATYAGIANVEELKQYPSFIMMPQRRHIDRSGAVEITTGLPEGVVDWPEWAKSVLVIAYYHPADDKYLDTWVDDTNPPGNRILMHINRQVDDYIAEKFPEIQTKRLVYHVEKGGIWLKDAAVLAGLGILGKNNLLVTPGHGAKVRLRAMCLSEDLPSTGKLDWDPCDGCEEYCRKACPQGAFDKISWTPEEFEGVKDLPGRDGRYDMVTCDIQMEIDLENGVEGDFFVPNYGKAHLLMPYCRCCETACPIGKNPGPTKEIQLEL